MNHDNHEIAILTSSVLMSSFFLSSKSLQADF